MEPEQYLQNIIEPLLDNQSPITIERKLDDRGILLTLSVSEADMGRIIGKQGDTARAIRRLLRQFGMTHDQRIALKINEPA